MAGYGAVTPVAGANGTGTTTTNSTTNMDPASLAALTALIAQLSGGGTGASKQQGQNIASEIATNRGNRDAYSKDNAFADAQGAMNAQVRTVLEKLLPTLTRSAEGAGTSQSSLRALLTQDAANKAAESGAGLGLQAATAYGGVNANLSQILAGLVSQDDPTTKALLAALGMAKGAQTNSTTNTQQPVGVQLPNYSNGGNVGGSGNSSFAPAPTFTMGSSGPGMTDEAFQISNINKQLGIIKELTNQNAFGGNMSLISGSTF